MLEGPWAQWAFLMGSNLKAHAEGLFSDRQIQFFLFLYFLKMFFMEIYFWFHNLQFYTPVVPCRAVGTYM